MHLHDWIRKPIIQTALLVLFLEVNIYCDEIFLTNGQTAKTEIIDTNGCAVKILRNGNTVTIMKKLIRTVIWKSDTIFYENYVCQEKPKLIPKFEDTPGYKLMAILDNSSEFSRAFKENTSIAFLQVPLQGNYNSGEFIGVLSPLIELFGRKAKTMIINPAQMITELTSDRHNFDYAFFARKYHVEVNQMQRSEFTGMGAFGTNTQGGKKKELFSFGDFILYDISKKEIVLHQKLNEKRSVWGESEYSWVGILTPDEWQKEWEKEQTDRKIDRNAQAMRKKMEKEISRYLGIKD